MRQLYAVSCFIHEDIYTSIARVTAKDICYDSTLSVITLTHVGRLSVVHVPHAVIQTKHGRSMHELLTADTPCQVRLEYASSFHFFWGGGTQLNAYHLSHILLRKPSLPVFAVNDGWLTNSPTLDN